MQALNAVEKIQVDSDNAFLFLQKILGIYKQNKVMTVKTFIHS